MRTSVILIAVIALVAVHCANEVSADTSDESPPERPESSDSSSGSSEESDETPLLTEAARQHCKKLGWQFKQSSIWKRFAVEAREAIRHAIKTCQPPPFGEKWDDILNNPELLEKLTTQKVLAKIPTHPRQGLVDKARKEPWWRQIKKKERKVFIKIVLKNKNVPKQWKSWEEALADPKFAAWIVENRKTALEKDPK